MSDPRSPRRRGRHLVGTLAALVMVGGLVAAALATGLVSVGAADATVRSGSDRARPAGSQPAESQRAEGQPAETRPGGGALPVADLAGEVASASNQLDPIVTDPASADPATRVDAAEPASADPAGAEPAGARSGVASGVWGAPQPDVGAGFGPEGVAAWVPQWPSWATCSFDDGRTGGVGERSVVVDRERQRSWFCDGAEVVRVFPITTARSQPDVGVYEVYAKDMHTSSTFGGGYSTMTHFVAFTYGKFQGARVAFHSVPVYRDGSWVQPLDTVGDLDRHGDSSGCIRALPADAEAIWDWLDIGGHVRVIT